ncbi:hypothetical protein JCM3775_005783 [Rhodotorula graminis]
MASSAPGPSQQLVSPAAHLHAAPAYAVQPAPTVSTSFASTTANPTSSSSSSGAPSASSASKPIPGAPSPTLRPFTPRELKQLVLEYLCSRCYVDTAMAFASDLALADEAATGPSAGEPAPLVERGGQAGEGMDGIEATPEPHAGDEPRASSDAPPVSNGKSVAFLDGDGAEDEDEDGDVIEGSLQSKADVQDARLRRKIRDSILGGRISHAVDLLNEHYPSVLAATTTPSTTPPTASSLSSPSKLAPSHPLSPKNTRCTPQTFFVAPSPPSPSSSSGAPAALSSTKSLIGAHFGPHAQSLAPAILSLNLQTQVFVELMRSAYATSAHSTPSTPTPSAAAAGGGGGAGASDDADMSASTSSLGTFSILNVAIAQAQALAEKVSHLPPGREREGWDRERVDVSALLAYKNIETCEVRGYFDEARKEALAEMVNAAVLQHTSRTPMPLLSLAARQATAFWSTLREMNVPFPPPSSTKTSNDASSNGKAKPAKTAPAFDLHSFLHEREPGASSSATGPDGDVEMAP